MKVSKPCTSTYIDSTVPRVAIVHILSTHQQLIILHQLLSSNCYRKLGFNGNI